MVAKQNEHGEQYPWLCTHGDVMTPSPRRDLCLQTHFCGSAAARFAVQSGPFHAVIRCVLRPFTASFAGWQGYPSQQALSQ